VPRLSRNQKEELVVQLLLMGVSLALTLIVYWVILTPSWKRQLMVTKVQKAMEDGSNKIRELTGKEILLVQEFVRRVSEWDHEQAAESQKKRMTSNASEGNDGMGTCDSPEESN
jgi:LPS O-antigen subunit length determinant protein (WzzB/FepE family)